MTNQEYVLDTMRRAGKSAAESLQTRASELTGTEIYAEEAFLSDFCGGVSG